MSTTVRYAASEPSVEAGGADRRRGRRNKIIILASLAVVASLVAVAVWPYGRRSPEPAAPSAAPLPVALDLSTARPAEEVWPDAVIRLPSRLPDERPFTVKARVDEDRFVVVPHTGSADDLPVLYDAGDGDVIDLIPGPRPRTLVGSARVDISDRDIVVAVSVRERHEVWVAPRSGGSAERRAVFEDAKEVGAFGAGDEIFAVVTTESPELVTTAYKLPVDESPEQVATATGVPESPYGRWFMTGSPTSQGPTPDPDPFTFVDVVTGEQRTTKRLDGLTRIVCTPDVCAGLRGDDLVAYAFDGTNAVRITGLTPDARNFPVVISATGRFIGVRDGQPGQSWERGYVWDRQKNVAAMVPFGLDDAGWLQLLRSPGDEFQNLIDLSRIP